jgi:hypothetical protein
MRTWTIRRNGFCFAGNRSASLPIINRQRGTRQFGSYCFTLEYCLYRYNRNSVHDPFPR